MLHPSLTDERTIDHLRAHWHTRGSLRVAPFLAEDTAEELHGAVQQQPLTLQAPPPSTFNFQYWAYAFQPEPACDHLLCRVGRWLFSDGAAWVSALTGLRLGPPADRVLMTTLYSRGSYLDAHNDHDGARQVAYILGLTRDTWPAEHGGHLEFLRADERSVHVIERRPPGWNTLDLFDVRRPVHLHRVPILRRRAERRAITGWFYALEG